MTERLDYTFTRDVGTQEPDVRRLPDSDLLRHP